MIKENIKKIFSSIIITTYIVFYTAPMGMCISVVPQQIDTGIQKPALRGTNIPSVLKLEGDISISKQNPKITLSLRDSDVKQVLRMLADKAGLNIIFHSSVDDAGSGSVSNNSSSPTPSTNIFPNISPNSAPNPISSLNSNPRPDLNSSSSNNSTSVNNAVSGPKITLDLVNVPLNDAFKMILQVTNLTYYIDNNTIIIASANAARNLNLAKQELMTIPVKYVDAATLANFLNKNIFSINKPGLSNAEIAITDPGSNSILIFGTKNDFLMAQKIIAQFDKKPLEKTFIVNYTTPKEMANLLCSVLFKSDSGSSSSSNSNSNSNSSPTPSFPGMPTGGAADVGSSSGGGSSSSGGGSSGGSSSDLTLGAGVVACQISNNVDTGSLSSLSSSGLSITYFAQRGTISVMGGSEQQIELIKDFIAKNDKKQPQAYLEVSIIELNESGTKQFDNTWNLWSDFFSGSFDGKVSTNPLYPSFVKGDGYTLVDPSTYPPTIKQVFNKYNSPMMITYTMSYLIQNGKGRVLANPRILITNGQSSSIDLSSDYVKTVTSQVLTSGGSLTPTIQRTYEIGNDEGIKVNLEPFISPDGYVTLNIKPDYATEKEKVYSPSADGKSQDLAATLLQRRNLDLKNVRIKDGETLVIGGMIRETEQKTISKIPVLGDLPGLGMFFRNTDTTKEKNELVIMITPKIIKDSEDVVSKQDTTL